MKYMKTVQGKPKNILQSTLDAIKVSWIKHKWLYIMSIPFIAYYVIFHYMPMYGATIAFKDYDVVLGVSGSPWVGFKHFKDFFHDFYFTRVIRNTLLISIYNLLWSFPAPIIFALLMNELRSERFKKTVQTITYLPHFISLIVICGMLTDFLAQDGLISVLLSKFGFEPTYYLSYPQYFRTIYIASGIWQGIGWNSIIYLSALSGIDQQLYEAARIDGASKLRQVWHVTLPGIIPTIMTLLILQMGKVMSVGYEKIILLYNGNTYETADVLSSYIYRLGLSGTSMRYSYTTAIGLFSSLINIILLVTANKISKAVSESSLW
ncbi:MAG: sugar ABC transporter permease [Clostridia bacterium]|nr:sugar ABC transporter permease [Clostridia bacterium]